MPDRRDDDLRALLPSLDAPYNNEKLSEAETSALETALGDGFGFGVRERFPIPGEIDSGLLPAHFCN